MKRVWLFALLVWLACPAQAQTLFRLEGTGGGRLIYMPRPQTFDFRFQIPEAVFRSYTPSSPLETDAKLGEYMPEYMPASAAERPMDMQVRSAAYRPFFNIYAPMLRTVSPTAFDFRETSLVPLNEQTTFFTTGRLFTWPGAGGITDITSGLVWQQGQLTLSGSAFAGRYYTPLNLSPAFMAGAGVEAHYQVSSWLGVRSWGQYTRYGEGERFNPYMLTNPFFNHTGAGGAIELHLNEDLGVGVGVNYEYNPWKRKMEPHFLFYPVGRGR